MRDFAPTQHKPYEQVLFPQDLQTGEASVEEICNQLDLADWTISAMGDAIKLAREEDEPKITNLLNETSGVRTVLLRQLDNEQS